MPAAEPTNTGEVISASLLTRKLFLQCFSSGGTNQTRFLQSENCLIFCVCTPFIGCGLQTSSMITAVARKQSRLTNALCGERNLIGLAFNYSSRRCNLSHQLLFPPVPCGMLVVAYRKRRARPSAILMMLFIWPVQWMVKQISLRLRTLIYG